jgi:hypothetical protein
MARSVAASACFIDRLVIPYTTSTDLTPFTVRSRVILKPCFSPFHFCPTVRIDVASNVRFSIRPCPFSTVVATRSAGADVGASSGGSGRRDPSGGLLEGEPGPDVGLQPRLVVLHDQEVIAPGIDDSFGQVPLAEHRVADHHFPAQG